jgi:hypothetical protein
MPRHTTEASRRNVPDPDNPADPRIGADWRCPIFGASMPGARFKDYADVALINDFKGNAWLRRSSVASCSFVDSNSIPRNRCISAAAQRSSFFQPTRRRDAYENANEPEEELKRLAEAAAAVDWEMKRPAAAGLQGR